MVKLSLQRPGHTSTIEITACTSPVICSSLPALVDVTKYEYLAGLELADECTGQWTNRIDVLIGSNYYWTVVTGKVVNSDSGPVAMESVFGWLLSGPVENCKGGHVNTHHTHVIITDITGFCKSRRCKYFRRSIQR